MDSGSFLVFALRGGGRWEKAAIKVLQQVASCSAALLIAILHVNGAGGERVNFRAFQFGCSEVSASNAFVSSRQLARAAPARAAVPQVR